MARRLTDANIKYICEMIDGWRGPLTWERLADAVEGAFRHRYTRQALNAHERIRTAYAVYRNVFRNMPEQAPKGSLELQAAQERITRLKAQNTRLEVENERLLGQFVRWLYNASLHGLDQETLNRSLPSVDRDRTNLALADISARCK
jgi:hypothetical protein